MDEITSCPSCHQPIGLLYYFCPNCGKQLHIPPLSTSPLALFTLCLKTLLLPPFGLLWGFRYIRQSDNLSKFVGFFTILITLLEIIWLVQATITTINTVNQQILQQSQLYGL